MAVGVTSLIVVPYIRKHRIDDGATVKNGEAVFTHSSPRSSAPGTDRGTPAAIGSASPAAVVTELRTGSRAHARDPMAGLKGQRTYTLMCPAVPFCRRKSA